jgi:hypothetical protein
MATPRKKHACDICGKLLTRSTTLRDHQKIHSGEKPHECKICAKAFARRPDVLQHEKTHGAARTFVCGLPGTSHATCQARFLRKRDLERHQRNAGLMPEASGDPVEAHTTTLSAVTSDVGPDCATLDKARDTTVSSPKQLLRESSGRSSELGSCSSRNDGCNLNALESSVRAPDQVSKEVVESTLWPQFRKALDNFTLLQDFAKAAHCVAYLLEADESSSSSQVLSVTGQVLQGFRARIEHHVFDYESLFGVVLLLVIMVTRKSGST